MRLNATRREVIKEALDKYIEETHEKIQALRKEGNHEEAHKVCDKLSSARSMQSEFIRLTWHANNW